MYPLDLIRNTAAGVFGAMWRCITIGQGDRHRAATCTASGTDMSESGTLSDGNHAMPAFLAGVGLLVAYVVTGKLGLLLAVPPGFASPFFPPTGIAIAAVLIRGRCMLPWTGLAALMLASWFRLDSGLPMEGVALSSTLLMATVATLQAALGAWALKKLIGYPAPFDKAGDVWRFLLSMVLLCLFGAGARTGGLVALGLLVPADALPVCLIGWGGDTLGVFIMVPLSLILAGEPRVLWRRRALSVAVPVMLTAMAFMLMFVQSRKWEQEESLSQFRMLSRQLADKMQGHFNAQEGLLEQAEGLFMGKPDLSRDEFHRVMQKALARQPAFKAVEWAPLVVAADRRGFELRQGRDLPGFAIRERGAGGNMLAAGSRPYFYPVTYAEPLRGNEAAIGYDLASSPERLAALSASLERRVAVATAPLTLVQEHGSQTGMLLFRPVQGPGDLPCVVLSVLRMGDFMDSILPFAEGMLFARVIDSDAGKIVFDWAGAPGAAVLFERDFSFGTRHYILQTAPSAAYRAAHTPWDSWIILAAGIFGTGLILSVLLLGTAYTYRVETEVVARTREVDEGAARLKEITATLGEGVIVMDQQGRIEFSNPEARRLLGWRESDLASGHPPRPLFQGAEAGAACCPAEVCVLQRARDSGKSYRSEDEIFWCRDGSPLNVAVCYSPIIRDGKFAGVVAAFRDVSARKRADEALRASEARFRNILERAPIGMALVSLCGQFVQVNQALCDILGYARDELQRLTFLEILHPEDLAASLASLERLLLGKTDTEASEQRYFRKDGGLVWIMLSVSVLGDERGCALELIAQAQDITERKRDEAELNLAASVFRNTMDGVMVTDADSRILSVNPAFTRITGYSATEALGQKPSLLSSDHHGAVFYTDLWQQLGRDGRWEGEVWNRRKNGEEFLEWLTIGMVPGADGKPERYVGVFNDITELRQKDEHIRHQAFHDALTGLPNRALLLERLRQRTSFAHRGEDRFGVMFIDLDRFKAVNDSLGHDIGDGLLREVAGRLLQCVRSTDTVARMGGDEFVVLLDSGGTLDDFAALAKTIIAKLSEPACVAGHTLQVGASVGIACCPDDGRDAVALMKHADAAMYAAKSDNGGGYRFFQSAMSAKASQRLQMEMELRTAVASGGLELFYQPTVSLASAAPSGVEALVRWRHPRLGLVPPGDFIPLAEETGIIQALGDWVLAEACRQVAVWRTQGLGLIPVAVNLSACQLQQGDLVDRITCLAGAHGFPPSVLQIELTESSVMANPEHVAAVFTRLRQIGVCVAIDDFGTGYSSLAYLRRLPIDVLKIDRSFVMNADRDDGDAQIVRTILALGQALKLSVVAEGVETESQADFLRSCGCTTGQGYLYARPGTAADIGDWLRSRGVVADDVEFT